MTQKRILIFSGFLFLFLAAKFLIPHSFDVLFMQAMHRVSGPFFNYSLVPFIVVGSIEISVLIFFLFSFYLYQKGYFKKAYLMLASLLMVTAIEHWMKQHVSQPIVPAEWVGRFPSIPIIGSTEVRTNYSFPSGHSLRSMLLLGFLFMWKINTRLFLSLIVIYAILQLIGMNYYGFHWASDVIGGYVLASATLWIVQEEALNEL